MNDDRTRSTDYPVGERRWQWAWDSLALMGCMIAIAAVSSLLVRAAGEQYPINATRVPVPWVPLGIAVGVLYFRGSNRWPGVLAGAIGTGLVVGGIPPAAAVVQGLSATVFALGIRALLRAWRVNAALERWQDPLLLWLAAAIGATAMGCVAGTAVLATAGLQADQAGHGLARALLDANGHPIFRWPLLLFAACWSANWTSGIALVVPALRLLNSATWEKLGQRLREVLVMALVLVGWAIAAFLPLPWVASLPLCLIALVLVTWSAMRFGAAVASFIPLALALIESAAFIAGRGPLQARPQDAIWAVWTFILIISLLGMLITSLLAERDAAHRRQAMSEMRYRVLFESSPRPLWVYDPAKLRILMVNGAAVRLYGYPREEFTDLNVWDLDAGDASSTTTPNRVATELDKGEHRHRTRSGTIIEVELHAELIEFDGRPARLVFSDDVTDRNRLRGALLDAADHAGRQLGRELHDGLGQDLVALSLIARAETDRISKGGPPELKALALIESVALRAVKNCRGVARGLSALAESGGDLYGALRRLPDRFPHEGPPSITVTIEDDASLALPEGAQDHIFRIAQEALTNAVKHAGARRIDVVLRATQAAIRLTVRDDGIGLLPSAAQSGGLGRASMRHRASAIGALLYVSNAIGGGTEVRLDCPQHAKAREERGWG
ncbi:MAG: PAS domain S-box protein [Steroidobacteraceae bacterium]